MTDASFTSQPVKTWAKRNARLYAGKKIWSEIRTRFVGEFSTKRMEKQAYFSLLILFTSPPSCVKNGVRKIPANRPPVVLRPAAGCGKQAKPTNLKRNNMTKLISKMFSLATMAALVAGLTGCKSVCPFCHQPNQGFATIISQPVDQTTNLNKTAYFAVNVDGNNPSFQWFFRGLSNEVPRIIEGADHRELSFTVTSEEQEGFYFCVIDSYGSLGKQRTRTRDAYLLVNSSI